MTTGTIRDYIGYGLLSARPASPAITSVTGGSARYYATDTGAEYAWDGSAWHAVTASGVASFSWAGKSANYTILTSDYGILVDTAGGAVTITLPTAVSATQGYVIKKKTSDANAVTINTTSAQTIDGLASGVITLTEQNQSIEVGSDNVNWYVVARSGLSKVTALLGADVTMTSANTFYDGPTATVSPGEWLVTSGLTVKGGASTGHFTGKLWDGTTVLVSQGIYLQATGQYDQLVLSWPVAVASSTTFKMSVAAAQAGQTIAAATATNAAGNTASWIHAVRIA